MKKRFVVLSIICLIISILSIQSNIGYAYEDKIFLGGMPAGFSLQTKGASIIALCDVVGVDNVSSPAKDSGLLVGDTILSIDNIETNNAVDIERNILNKSSVQLLIKRNQELITKDITLAKDVTGKNKLGVFVRDGINGIGTITFIKNGKIGSLGHAVVDENNKVLEITGGNMYPCTITDFVKSEKGCPGELRGVFNRKYSLAKVISNNDNGVYGSLNTKFEYSKLQTIDIGSPTVGNAKIYTTIKNDDVQSYSISIIKAETFHETKNIVIKITDKKLLSLTGGICQGMSGSPIVQNGKLVGAVTHVFVNDPTRGYGINIQNMLNNI